LHDFAVRHTPFIKNGGANGMVNYVKMMIEKQRVLALLDLGWGYRKWGKWLKE
jgi:hypothetical protein